MEEWMGSMYYRGIDPSEKGYADLRYWHKWHELIEKSWKPPSET